MDFLNLNESVHHAIRIAKGIARDHSHPHYAPAHLLCALTHNETRMMMEILGVTANPMCLSQAIQGLEKLQW